MTDVAIAGAGLDDRSAPRARSRLHGAERQLNVAAVGVGGQGRTNLVNLASENIVALCDVDWDYANKGFAGLDTEITNQQERLDARRRISRASTRKAGPNRR